MLLGFWYDGGMENRDKLFTFIKSKFLMTISSVDAAGKPEAAVVGFGAGEGARLMFGTSKQSRKCANVLRDGRVAVVIGWDWPETVQLEGVARAVTVTEAREVAPEYFAENPRAKMRQDDADEQYFVVEPSWARYANMMAPGDGFEVTF